VVIETDAKINWNKLKGIPSATVSAQGIVQLNDSLNSSSTTQAATPNAIRVLKELIDSKAGIQGAVMDDLKIKNWIRIGNVILRPNPTNKTLDFIWTDDPM
ncbi:MAG: tail fiber protein, partial [Bacteroidales bacterium]